MGLFKKGSTITYTVGDMNCSHCEAKVTTAIEGLANVTKVRATASDKRLVITYEGDAGPDLAAVNAALEPAGYHAAAAK